MPKNNAATKPSRLRSGGEERSSKKPWPRRLTASLHLRLGALGVLTVAMLALSFAPFDLFPLAFVALVPWLVIVAGPNRPRLRILYATLTGLVFWAASLYWLWWITLVGYVALVLFLTLYWLIPAIAMRAAIRRGWPTWFVLPVIWVALEFVRSYGLSGFTWFYLGHSQYRQLPLIQIADITSDFGVSFVVAAVNGLAFDLLRRFAPRLGGGERPRRVVVGVAVTAVLVGGVVGYGYWRLGQKTLTPGPVIGIVQQAYPITLSGVSVPEDTIAQTHLRAAAKAFTGTGCDVVVLPEAMLQSGLNASFCGADSSNFSDAQMRALTHHRYFPEDVARYSPAKLMDDFIAGKRERAKEVGKLSQALDCAILAGGVSLHPNPAPLDDRDLWLSRNSLMLFDRDWRCTGLYSKMHLVPFGEYVPFRQGWPALHKLLRKFVPSVMEQLDPGRDPSRLELSTGGRTYRIAAPICYEGTFARVCRRLTTDDSGRKAADIIVNVSNDGWFVWRGLGGAKAQYRGSTEHAQHLVQYCFRAVENRTPVVRAVNTGISASIDPNGRIVADLRQYDVNTMVVGTMLLDGGSQATSPATVRAPKVLVDSRASLYSQVGNVFAAGVSLLAAGLVVRLVLSGRRRRTDGSGQEGKEHK